MMLLEAVTFTFKNCTTHSDLLHISCLTRGWVGCWMFGMNEAGQNDDGDDEKVGIIERSGDERKIAEWKDGQSPE